jgi:hypothetical protein
MNRSPVAILLCLVSCSSVTQRQELVVDVPTVKLYDVVIETGMAHLDENLRYATIRDRRCLDANDLARAFPVLNDVSLQDCRLALVAQRAESASYALQCSGGHGTTGEALWEFDAMSIAGTLNVKLGGKNMTFNQRVTGRALGACSAASQNVTSSR